MAKAANKTMNSLVQLLLVVATMLQLTLPINAQQDFSVAQVPDPFRVGDMYPPRSEVDVCRPIQDYIDRSSARYDSQLVTNTNGDIIFDTADSRIMSSRLQSRLNTLATSYKSQFGRKMTVLKAWTPFPDSDLAGDDLSLHYEGEWVLFEHFIVYGSLVKYLCLWLCTGTGFALCTLCLLTACEPYNANCAVKVQTCN